MSDPEDLQVEGEQIMADDWTFQLRRIGSQATCSKVPDIMRLNLGLTRIGRGQHNDYYLDSAVLKNFISRSHVEIFGKQNENGEIEFILTDKGLNGTFINDIRTHKTCTLEVGDKITFGHTNGYKIQPGSYAEQPQSEFQFQFERIPRKSKTSEMFSEDLTPNTTPVEESEIHIDLKKDATIVSDRLFKNNDIQSNVEQTQEKSAKSRPSQKSRSRKDSSSHSDNDIDISKNSSVQRGRRSSGKVNSESSSKSPTTDSISGSKRKVSTGSNKDVFSETLPAADDVEEVNEEENEEEEEEEEVEEVVKKKKGTKKGKASEILPDMTSSQRYVRNSYFVQYVFIMLWKLKANSMNLDPNWSQSPLLYDDAVNIQVYGPDFTFTEADRLGCLQISSYNNAPKKGGKRKVVEPPSDSEESSEEDDSSKPEADQRPKTQSQTNSKQKPAKKKRPGNDAPAVGSRKRRRKVGAAATSAASTSDNLEPGVEWYEDDTCDSADCKRPKKKRTPWVQCDDCDGWYHTVCVGANYNKLKDSDEHFNCGCE